MRSRAPATGGVLLLASIGMVSSAPASNVGRRFPSERRTFVDVKTGVTITALTTSPTDDIKIYQTHPSWTADAKHIVFHSDRTGDGHRQAFAVSEATGEIIQLTDGPDVNTGSLCLARKANRLYYFRGRALMEVNLDPLLRAEQTDATGNAATGERTVMTLPPGTALSGGFTIDADDRRAYVGLDLPGEGRWEIRRMDLRTGETARVIKIPFRVGHSQANPFVPGEILYCHETGGDAPQRMWLVRADGTRNQPLYREKPYEWVTHEVWWDRDHVLFTISGHLPELRTKPHGLAAINVRSRQSRIHDQAAHWHCTGTRDRWWAVTDTSDGELYLIDVTHDRKILLSTGHRPPAARPHAHQSMSPDGKRVLFCSGLLGSSDLMTITLPRPDALDHP